jgi:hypothetical protein
MNKIIQLLESSITDHVLIRSEKKDIKNLILSKKLSVR